MKTALHQRNPHRSRYDFPSLVKANPALAPFVSMNPYGNESIDFADALAVKELNRALLRFFYDLTYWDIPEGYLCPPIPGRADYIHYIADLLSSCNDGQIPMGQGLSILDIGTGANCVYPIIGCKEYRWRFTGTDIDPVSLKAASAIVSANPALSPFVGIRAQADPSRILSGVIDAPDFFDAVICNPPFHASMEEAKAGTKRKLNNLGKVPSAKGKALPLNFGGRNTELWYPGGEVSFIQKMIAESVPFGAQCLWFTSLVSKKENLDTLYKTLHKANPIEVRTIEMAQGQKTSRFIAWSFMDEPGRTAWKETRWKKG